MRERGSVPPSKGGCWFCFNKDQDMEYSCEWDANFHMSCLHEALKDQNNDEAKIIAREFGIQVRDEIYFAKLREDATIPSRREEDSAYDMYAIIDGNDIEIPPHKTVILHTGIISSFDKKYRIILAERGSTGTIGIGQRAGVFDSGFRGEWKVPITNHNNTSLIIYNDKNGQIINKDINKIYYPMSKAICQALVEEVPNVNIIERTVGEIMAIKSERGDGMLGSSGK